MIGGPYGTPIYLFFYILTRKVVANKHSQQFLEFQQRLDKSPAYIQFISSLRSRSTKQDYAEALVDFIKFIKHDSCDDILKLEPKQIQLLLIQYIVDMRDNRKLAPNSIRARMTGVQAFLLINDIEGINWVKVKKFRGEHYRVADDRPYTREEIITLVNSAHNLRDKTIILLLSSSGVRIGGLVGLQLRHLKPINKYNIFQIEVYKKAKEQYITFCTPETRKSIEEYLDWRSRLGEKLTQNSPLFRAEFDTRIGARAPAKPVTYGLVVKLIRRLRATTGIVQVQHITESVRNGAHRSDIMTVHGFRKHFATTLETEGVNPVFVELLLGHDMGLKTVYAKPKPMQLLEGNGNKVSGYIEGINALTINEENRLKMKVQNLEQERNSLLTDIDPIIADKIRKEMARQGII